MLSVLCFRSKESTEIQEGSPTNLILVGNCRLRKAERWENIHRRRPPKWARSKLVYMVMIMMLILMMMMVMMMVMMVVMLLVMMMMMVMTMMTMRMMMVMMIMVL